jgi:hypothetical protein
MLPKKIITDEAKNLIDSLSKITFGNYISDIFVTYQSIANPNAIKVSRALLRRKISEGEVMMVKKIFNFNLLLAIHTLFISPPSLYIFSIDINQTSNKNLLVVFVKTLEILP